MTKIFFRLPAPAAAGVAVLAVAGLGLSACGGSSPAPSGTGAPTGAGGTHITIKNFMFMPMAITVKPGATLTVTNQDSTVHTLTATGGGASFTTGDIPGGASKTVTVPTRPGRYSYNCAIHNYMTGTITVSG